MKTIINILLLALLANLHVTTARDYIMVMRDGTPTSEMDNVMDIMCEMSPGECSNRDDFRRTYSLMNTITGPMSDNAVEMVSKLIQHMIQCIGSQVYVAIINS